MAVGKLHVAVARLRPSLSDVSRGWVNRVQRDVEQGRKSSGIRNQLSSPATWTFHTSGGHSTPLWCISERRALLTGRGSASEQQKDNGLNTLSTGEKGSVGY